MRSNTVGSAIWRETLKIVKNEKYALYYLAYGEKPDNHRK